MWSTQLWLKCPEGRINMDFSDIESHVPRRLFDHISSPPRKCSFVNQAKLNLMSVTQIVVCTVYTEHCSRMWSMAGQQRNYFRYHLTIWLDVLNEYIIYTIFYLYSVRHVQMMLNRSKITYNNIM